MFDDQPLSPGGAPPSNLPVGEPEDILASADSMSPTGPQMGVNLQSSPAVESAPAKSVPTQTSGSVKSAPTALGAGVLKPKIAEEYDEDMLTGLPPSRQDLSAPPPPVRSSVPKHPSRVDSALPSRQSQESFPNQGPLSGGIVPTPPHKSTQKMYDLKSPSTSKGVMGILIFLILFLVLGAVFYFVYANFIKSDEGFDNDLDIVIDDTIEDELGSDSLDSDNSEGLTEEDIASDILDDQILFGEPIDRDGDGLDDDREASVGTDPKNWDSDGDELSDGDEVIIWKSDPLDPDTDDDGYLDGAEIKSGYSPTGPGKLFDLPPSENSEEVENPTSTTDNTVSTST